MKTKQYPLWFRATAALCVALLISVSSPLPVQAIDVQALPIEQAAATGYTHAARITWDDLNAADASAVVLQVFAIPTNSYIDRVSFYVEENFTNAAYATGTSAGSNLVMTIGVGGTTNFFFGSNVLDTTHWVGATNSLIPHKSSTSTNYLIACFSDGIQASAVDNYLIGKVRIYFRLIQPYKYKF